MKILKLLLAVTVLALLFSECRYSFIVPENIPEIDTDDPNAPQISFANEIEPIFNDNNNCTSCHKTGSQLPDLSTGNAFKSINSSRYINDNAPEESLIYKHPNPDNAADHKQKKYTAAQAALVLGWIKQGAKNN